MRLLLENAGRLTVSERAEILAIAKADPTVSATELAKQYDVHRATVKRLLAKAGLAREHGGARAGAGQKGRGARLAEKRVEETPEMIWVDALSRLYGLGINDEQYRALRAKYPAIPARRRPPEERLDMIYEALDLYYPVLKGRRTDGRDMGEDVLSMANTSIAAIMEELPLEDPAARIDVMAAIQQQAAEHMMAPGTRRIGAVVEERGVQRVPRGLTAGATAIAEEVASAQAPAVPPAPEVLADIPEEEREEFLRAWLQEQREAAAGVKRIDPATYAHIKKLEDEIEALKKKKQVERTQRLAREQMSRMFQRNPDAEDKMADAFAMLIVYTAPRSPLGAPIHPKRPKRRQRKTAKTKREIFRRLMRL